jgi:hypothetical protein
MITEFNTLHAQSYSRTFLIIDLEKPLYHDTIPASPHIRHANNSNKIFI